MKKSAILLFIFIGVLLVVGASVFMNKKQDAGVNNSPTPNQNANLSQTGSNPADSKIDCNRAITLSGTNEYRPNNVAIGTGAMIFLDTYYGIKKNFGDQNFINEVKKEHNLIKTLASKQADCSSITRFDKTDNYSYQLCQLYKAKDIKGIESYKIDDGDEDVILALKSLINGKFIDGAKESIYNGVLHYENHKKDVEFKFVEDPDFLLPEYYTFYFNNDKAVFFEKLDKQFVEKCNNLNTK